MADIFKTMFSQLGFGGGDKPAAEEIPLYVDPEQVRLADAELDGGAVIASRRQQLAQQTQGRATANSAPPSDPGAESPVDLEGNVDFEKLFAQAGIQGDQVSADQAAKVIVRVEKKIPAVISDPKERDGMLRDMLLATMEVPAAPERIVLDAQRRTDALTNFMRTSLELTANYQQSTDDAIKELEAKIERIRIAKATSDKQFTNLSSNCKQRQSEYARVIDLFSDPNAVPSK